MPVYNVEAYLDKAIESVLGQVYLDFELIIIDDGSTDNSYLICEKYKKSDSRIVLIHQNNYGLASARNHGIKIAVGEYILFMDSDDYWYDKNVLSKIDKCILEYKSEMVVFSFAKLYSNKIINCNLHDWNCKLNRHQNSLVKFMLQKNIYKACAWNKCIKKEIIDLYEMQFPEGYLNEDIIWCGDLLQHCKRISYINDVCYIYRQGRKGSITANKNNKNISDRVDLIDKGIKQLQDSESKKIILNYYAYEYCVSLGLVYLIKKRKTRMQLQELKYLLNYDLNKKVYMVHKLSTIFGFGAVRIILCIFVKLIK